MVRVGRMWYLEYTIVANFHKSDKDAEGYMSKCFVGNSCFSFVPFKQWFDNPLDSLSKLFVSTTGQILTEFLESLINFPHLLGQTSWIFQSWNAERGRNDTDDCKDAWVLEAAQGDANNKDGVHIVSKNYTGKPRYILGVCVTEQGHRKDDTGNTNQG